MSRGQGMSLSHTLSLKGFVGQIQHELKKSSRRTSGSPLDELQRNPVERERSSREARAAHRPLFILLHSLALAEDGLKFPVEEERGEDSEGFDLRELAPWTCTSTIPMNHADTPLAFESTHAPTQARGPIPNIPTSCSEAPIHLSGQNRSGSWNRCGLRTARPQISVPSCDAALESRDGAHTSRSGRRSSGRLS